MVDRTRTGEELREEFKVLGSTGNVRLDRVCHCAVDDTDDFQVYTVIIDKTPTCNCQLSLSLHHRSHSEIHLSQVPMPPKGTIVNTSFVPSFPSIYLP